jgi:hypothetical protein
MLALAETLVNAFCHALGINGNKREPEVDPYELAKRAGAEARVEQALQEDGRMEESPLATRIVLWGNPAEARRRFTLGHELGHLVLSDPRVFRLVQLELGGKRFQVEHLCDAFSAELLMPRRWLVNRYTGSDERLDVLFDLSRMAGVSVTAGLIRLTSVLDWHSSLLYLRRGDSSLTVAGGPWQSARIRLNPPTLENLCHLQRQRRAPDANADRSRFQTVELRLGEQQRQLPCELRPTRKGIWIMAILPKKEAWGDRPAKPPGNRAGVASSGSDGTRTRDLWRDRPAL